MKDIKTLPQLSENDFEWGVLTATLDDGSPLIVRFNKTAKDWIKHPDLPIKLGFAIPLNAPVEGGMPNSLENEQLYFIEDVLLQEIEAHTFGIQALVLTTGFMKEFVFYIPYGVNIEAIHQAVQKAVDSHEVQCMAFEEQEWESFQQFYR